MDQLVLVAVLMLLFGWRAVVTVGAMGISLLLGFGFLTFVMALL